MKIELESLEKIIKELIEYNEYHLKGSEKMSLNYAHRKGSIEALNAVLDNVMKQVLKPNKV